MSYFEKLVAKLEACAGTDSECELCPVVEGCVRTWDNMCGLLSIQPRQFNGFAASFARYQAEKNRILHPPAFIPPVHSKRTVRVKASRLKAIIPRSIRAELGVTREEYRTAEGKFICCRLK